MPNRIRRKGKRPGNAARAMPTIKVEIVRMGARGDGVADSPNGPLFIPYSVPGDIVTVQPGQKRGDGFAADIVELNERGAERTDPACRHFGECGGCSLQHLSTDLYRSMKHDLLMSALARKGLGHCRADPIRLVGPASRRRMRLSALRLTGRTVLGFNRRAGNQIVDIAECPVARPELSALIPPLRSLAGALDSLGRGGDIQITLTDSGPDILIVPLEDSDLSLSDRETCTEFAQRHDIARVAWQYRGFGEPVAARRPAVVHFAGIPVSIPVGTFLQPSTEGENILTDLVLSALPGQGLAVADLFAGCGTFSLALAVAGANVQAFEIADDAVAALRRAAAGQRIQAHARNLDDDPLSAGELNAFDAVLFDPPRAGAAAQAEQIAESDVARVIAVSCNPSTLARDLAILADGGYELEKITPVDQFTWSAHLEAVAVMTRQSTK